MDTIDTERPNIKQTINDSTANVIQNNAPVYGDIKQTQITQDNSNTIAEYKNEPINYGSMAKLKKQTIILSALTVVSGLIGLFNEIASLFSTVFNFTGIEIATHHIQNTALGALVILAMLSIPRLFRYSNLRTEKWHRGYFTHTRYENNKGDKIIASETIADCPDKTCSGRLRLERPRINKQNVQRAGVCTQEPGLHIYSFDENTMRGRLINLDYIDLDKKD